MRPLVAHCHLGLGKLYRQTRDSERAKQHLTRSVGTGCWLYRPIQISLGGRRVYAAHVALLLHRSQPVTPETLSRLRLRRRCGRHRRCVNPVHVILLIRPESENMGRAQVIRAARAKMAAYRATRANSNHQETPNILATSSRGYL